MAFLAVKRLCSGIFHIGAACTVKKRQRIKGSRPEALKGSRVGGLERHHFVGQGCANHMPSRGAGLKAAADLRHQTTTRLVTTYKERL